MTADPAHDVSAFAARVQRTLDSFVEAQADRLADLGPDATLLLDEARVALAGGKRLRAAFCWWGHQAVAEVTDEEALMRACAALELLQASALVHDDYMDASDTRRGRPASHRAFEAHHRALGLPGDSEQYGAAAAILLGDLLLTWADEMLRRCGLPLERVNDALNVFDLCRSEVVAGQFLDVSVQARGHADVATAMTVLRYKSAKYSVERPLHIGAALAGATPAQMAALSDYGLPLGEAFQLRDDQLGVFGDPEVTGKPAGDDLVEGKRTVLVAHALDALKGADRTRLDTALGTELTVAEVAELRRLIADSGAAATVEALIDELTSASLDALAAGPFRPESQAALRELADAATRRTL